jgi:hypothetical protein
MDTLWLLKASSDTSNGMDRSFQNTPIVALIVELGVAYTIYGWASLVASTS